MPEQLHEMEPFYPLHVYVCDQCFLVQLQEFVTPEEIFTEYAYFSLLLDQLGGARATIRRRSMIAAVRPWPRSR